MQILPGWKAPVSYEGLYLRFKEAAISWAQIHNSATNMHTESQISLLYCEELLKDVIPLM